MVRDTRCRGSSCPQLLRMLILGDRSSGFGLREWKWPRRVADVVHTSRGGAGGGGERSAVVAVGKWFPLGTGDTVGSSSLSYEFCTLMNASIRVAAIRREVVNGDQGDETPAGKRKEAPRVINQRLRSPTHNLGVENFFSFNCSLTLSRSRLSQCSTN